MTAMYMHHGCTGEGCQICVRFGGKPSPTRGERIAARFPLTCVHRGEATGEMRECKTCGGRTATEPLFACAVHGVCTIGRLVAGVACCASCRDRRAS